MALINIDSALKQVLRQVKKLRPGQELEILSYKRNRSVSLLFGCDRLIQVRECGYREQDWTVGLDDLPKLLKSIIKIEFPRSRKVRVYLLSNAEKLNQARKKL